MHNTHRRIVALGTFALAFVIALSASITPVSACLNDSERREATVAGLPEADVIIAGGFARYPVEYYEARAKVLVPKIEARDLSVPLSEGDELGYFGLFDDLAVSIEKAGNSKEAISWMDRKLEEMDRLGYESDEQSSTNQRYTYYANIGTFRVHAWLKHGGIERKNMEQLDQAMAEIERAIEIYPDAHDGREGYQLQAMQWIRDLPDPSKRLLFFDKNSNAALPDMLGIVDAVAANSAYKEADEWKWRHEKYERRRLDQLKSDVRGLTGLISMGAAWESVDVFYALGLALRELGQQGSSLFAFERARDLARDDKKSIAAPYLSSYELIDMIDAQLPAGPLCYDPYLSPDENLVRAVNTWSKRQKTYIHERLTAGIKPVDVKAFWSNWSGDPYFLSYDKAINHHIDERCRVSGSPLGDPFFIAAGVLFLAFTVLAIFVLLRWNRRLKAQAKARASARALAAQSQAKRLESRDRPVHPGSNDDLI